MFLPNVACEFSGITAFATPEQRNPECLRPYLSEILVAFSSERIVWGSDWPVCNLADGLKRWSEISDESLGELSASEQVFFNEPLLVYADEKHSSKESRWYVLGRTENNRCMVIVFTVRKKRIRVISARAMSRKEGEIYEREI